MAHPKNINFSVNDYDSDGDIVERGIFLHFGDVRVKASDSIIEFREIVEQMEAIIKEIDETTPGGA